MAVSWKFDRGCVILDSDANGTLGEWKVALEEAMADPVFRPGMPIVHDARQLARVPNPDEARARVSYLLNRGKQLQIRRWAIVVTGNAQYGMGRMAEFLSDTSSHLAFRVFRDDLELAMTWATAEAVKDGHVA